MKEIEANWNMSNKENGVTFLQEAKKLYKRDPGTALPCINSAIYFFETEKDEDVLCDLAHSYYIKAYLEYYLNGNIHSADNFYIKSIETHIRGSYKNGYKKRRMFYKFFSIEDGNKESILSNIRLTHPSKFNDPMDCPIVQKEDESIPNKNILDGLRIGSFGEVKANNFYLSTFKWSFYGDSHKGICIVYDFLDLDKLDSLEEGKFVFSKVKYEPKYKPTKGIVGGSILTKSIDFEIEDEWRIVTYDRNINGNNPINISIPKEMVREVYFGCRCDDGIKEFFFDELKDYNNVKLFEIIISDDNFYELERKPYTKTTKTL